MRALKFVGWLFAWAVALGCAAWATGALYFDLPIPALRTATAILFVLLLLAGMLRLRSNPQKFGAVLAAFLIVLLWWLSLQPRDDRAWQPDVAETAWAEIDGDEVTLHNVRNFGYRTEFDYTPRWETRQVKLSQITGLDLPVTYWGSPYMAHPIASFQFADAPPVCFSIETRKEANETYSAIAGLYRQFELIYICAEERDVIRLRTNYRKGEDVYLYRLRISPEQARARFLEYVETINRLRTQPRWYNAVTTNCTTSIRAQHPSNERPPWDWRILINGKGDELLYERQLLATAGLSFADLKQRSLINGPARAADADPEFSRVIRDSLPNRQIVWRTQPPPAIGLWRNRALPDRAIRAVHRTLKPHAN